MFHPQGPTFIELARQALSSTEKGYDLLAPKFDYTPFRTPQDLLNVVQTQIAPLGDFGRGLDVCCGTGGGMCLLRPLCTRQVVGLDISRGMLEVARQRTPNAPGSALLDFVRGDALAMPFGPYFDIVVCFGAFGHILPKDQPRLVSEIARVLKPGGRFVFLTTYMPPCWSLTYWLARTFNAAMHVRNWIFPHPFIMYYLTFLLPETRELLETHGFSVEIEDMNFQGPPTRFCLVVATRSGP